MLGSTKDEIHELPQNRQTVQAHIFEKQGEN